MKPKSSVFDSKSEVNVFRSLQTNWYPRLALYPQLPLSKLIEVRRDEVSQKEFDFYLKTNVDYTFSDRGRPVFSIEFDGIGGGFSRDVEYVPARETPDPHRKLKIETKLRMTREAGYPLVVVSYDETTTLGPDSALTILDGIVGQILQERKKAQELAEIAELTERKDLADYAIQDLVLDASNGAMMENPIEVESQELQFRLMRLDSGFTERVEYLLDPPDQDNWFLNVLPDREFFNPEKMKESLQRLQNAERVGAKVAIKTSASIALETVWIRNFTGLGFFPHAIAEAVAKFIAYGRAVDAFPDK